jgi:response regulator RpfG family c-di-GMP phosphodiesterase
MCGSTEKSGFNTKTINQFDSGSFQSFDMRMKMEFNLEWEQMDIADYLAGSTFLAGLSPDIITCVAKLFEHTHYRAGEIIFAEGDKGKSFFLIIRGEVAILKGAGISERKLRSLMPGDGLGEMALISNAPRSATAKAVADTELLRLDHEGFNILIERSAGFAQRMLRIISDRLHEADDVATVDLLKAHQGLIISLAELAESRDEITGAHLYRVRDYCTLLAKLMADHPKFEQDITPEFIEAMYYVSPLHDIGKVAIPDSILNKKSELTPEEYEVMKTHTRIGAKQLHKVLKFCDLKMFHIAWRLILAHHERYDGHGYPLGLKGENIPLEARIMTLADVYDALLSKRSYKEAFSHDVAIRFIREEAGRQFDPDITNIMLEHIDQFKTIHLAYQVKEST